jgi:HK97 family phage portal protein
VSLLVCLTRAGARSLENPQTSLADPADWVYEATGGADTATGLRINADKALGYSAVWAAVNLLSCDVGKLPLFVYRRVAAGKERATAHPAYRLLRYAPNADMTQMAFRQALQAHVLLRGNGYALVEYDSIGRPSALRILNPDLTYPVRENGRAWIVVDDGTRMARLDPSLVLHLRGLSYDGIQGYSVLTYARETLASGIAARDYGSRFFRNSARPSVILEHPQTMSEEAQRRLKASWDNMHAGLENQHKTAVLEEGMKANVISISARDAQLLEQRQFEIREVANWFGLPPHKLGDPTRTAYASLEQENQTYLSTALDRWLVTWEEECREKLLTEDEKAADSHVVEFLRLALLRADSAARAAYYAAATAGQPWMTPDEARAAENMNEVGGAAGELHYPLNTSPEQDTEVDDDPNQDAGAVRAAVRPLVEDVARRMARRIAAGARRAKDAVAYANGLAAEHRDVLVEALTPAAKAAEACNRLLSAGAVADVALSAAARALAAGNVDEVEAKLPALIVGELLGD